MDVALDGIVLFGKSIIEFVNNIDYAASIL